ncbi:DUF6199 family natural product biosynthesis protein [Nonomuraea angiospora]|uniref:DUF6199 family natural product biosynthesis protein n=1 Tax=Nonomuraea angiospora TaxID=46172 RepID=UPI003444E67C
MIVFLVICSIAFFVSGLVNPRTLWRVTTAWQYRNPEANEPSDFAYGMGRGASFVGAIICLLFALNQCSLEQQKHARYATQPAQVETRTEAEVEALRKAEENPEPYDLMKKGVARALDLKPGTSYTSGHIIGYRGGLASSTVTIVYELSPCAHLHSAWADERYSYLSIRMFEATDGEKFTKGCSKKDRNRPKLRTKELTLLQPLGGRPVRAFHGPTIPETKSPRASEEPGERLTQENLLTPAGMRGLMAKLKPLIGGTKIVEMTVHPTYATIRALKKGSGWDEVYDYRNGAISGPKTGAPLDTELVDLADFNWDALPNLVKTAETELGVPKPTSRYVSIDPYFPLEQVLLVYVSDDHKRSGYLVASPQGEILKLYPER